MLLLVLLLRFQLPSSTFAAACAAFLLVLFNRTSACSTSPSELRFTWSMARFFVHLLCFAYVMTRFSWSRCLTVPFRLRVLPPEGWFGPMERLLFCSRYAPRAVQLLRKSCYRATFLTVASFRWSCFLGLSSTLLSVVRWSTRSV